MNQSKAAIAGFIGVGLFLLTTLIGGLLHPNYNHFSQFISELYAVQAPNSDALRFIGYIPSGLLFIIFATFAIIETPKSVLTKLGFMGVGFGYGIGTIICGIFICDIGCNPEFINPSLSQIIHNSMGFLTYLMVPFSILLIAITSSKWANASSFSKISYFLSLNSFVFVVILNSNLNSSFKGLFQRIIEISILLWILSCCKYLEKANKGL